jgi:hypothetical protein
MIEVGLLKRERMLLERYDLKNVRACRIFTLKPRGYI